MPTAYLGLHRNADAAHCIGTRGNLAGASGSMGVRNRVGRKGVRVVFVEIPRALSALKKKKKKKRNYTGDLKYNRGGRT